MALTLLRADRLPVEVVVEDLPSVVELWGRAAVVVGLHDDLRTPEALQSARYNICTFGGLAVSAKVHCQGTAFNSITVTLLQE